MKQPATPNGPQQPPSSALAAGHQVRELGALYDLGQALYAIHDLEELLQFAMDQVSALLEVESSAVILLDEEKRELYFQVVEHLQPGVERRLREVRLPADRGITGWVVQTGISALVPNVEQDPRYYPRVDEYTGMKTKSILCVPLRTRDRTIGAVSAVNKHHRSFVQEDLHL